MTVYYHVRGATERKHDATRIGETAKKCAIATAKNLWENGGYGTYVVAIDLDTKEEHLVWHYALGHVPYGDRHVTLDKLAEAI